MTTKGDDPGTTAMTDPFATLGVEADASDEDIKHRYLALVRAFPPDREPEHFQRYRAAYEALCDHRKRLEAQLLSTNQAALSRLKLRSLAAAKPGTSRASRSTVNALLAEGIDQLWPSPNAPQNSTSN
jgi:curved DNA-binding protein CbpA